MKIRWTVALLSLAAPAVAQAMPVETFLEKSDALKARGFTALFSADLKQLMDAIKADAAALNAERDAAKAANRTAAYCPPGPFKMSSDQIVEAMRAVPPAARATTDSRDALRAYFSRRFPCPTGH